MERCKDVVVGLGNPLMTDEGIGPCVVRRLRSKVAWLSQVDFVEQGCSPLAVLHAVAGRQKAILVDCALMEKPPGTIVRFTPEQVVSTRATTHLSLHDGDLLGELDLLWGLEEYPEEVVIFGIEPEIVMPGDRLSLTLRERLESYVEVVARELVGANPAAHC
jgi:hydrogenase maturation protease